MCDLPICSPAGKSTANLNVAESDFDKHFQTSWHTVAGRSGVLRGTIDKMHHRQLGKLGLVAHYNPDHIAFKRPTTICSTAESSESHVYRAFDKNGFHFNKVHSREVMMDIAQTETRCLVTGAANCAITLNTTSISDSASYHKVLINVSPLSACHSLLVPHPDECLPQTADYRSILLAMQVAHESYRDDIRIGFNSLGAFASVNHLHYHLFYTCWSMQDAPLMPIERSAKTPVSQCCSEEVQLFRLVGWPISSWCLQLPSDLWRDGTVDDYIRMQSFRRLSTIANAIVCWLRTHNIAHNLLISERGSAIYIIPRRHQKILSGDNVRVAVVEASGLCVCRSQEAYDAITADDMIEILKMFSMNESWIDQAEYAFAECAFVDFSGAHDD